MASTPGILSDWPWTRLGSFKHVLLAPWAIQKTYAYIRGCEGDDEMRDLSSFLIFPFLIWRMIHNQIWISISRYRTAKGNNRIVDKGIEFEQVDRERGWDDQIVFNGLLFYIGSITLSGGTHLPWWRMDGVIITIILHAGPVEFLYYWLHRALHHHFLYSRYHSHHHSSIVTEPITSVIHPFAEHIGYFTLFAIPMITTIMTRTASIISFAGYVTYIDFMNNMGHCNFELVPSFLFTFFPPLKFIIYTPSYHSLHHTQFRTNYSLFMPIYDYIYGTLDKSSDELYQTSLLRGEESPDVIHLTHLVTPESIYHLRLGFAYLAASPLSLSRSSDLRLLHRLLWPITLWTMALTWLYGRASFVLERHRFGKLLLQTWALPKYKIQYSMEWQKEAINSLVEEAIVEADAKGAKVLTLGLLNQGEELNGYGEMYVRKYPGLRTKVVDGSSLVVAVLLNSIPKGTTQVLIRGTNSLTKVASKLALTLCHRGLQKRDYEKLRRSFGTISHTNLLLSKSHTTKVWLVGEGLGEEEQKEAERGTLFIPFSQFPVKKIRKDCYYHTTPALVAPKSLENVDSCENWLGRRVMSAWRAAGVVHALENWREHECGQYMFDVDKVWEAALRHGFIPLQYSPIPPSNLTL
ncbi:Very-long-chain aldehyde decarbonylase CER1 [Linum perenne]